MVNSDADLVQVAIECLDGRQVLHLARPGRSWDPGKKRCGDRIDSVGRNPIVEKESATRSGHRIAADRVAEWRHP